MKRLYEKHPDLAAWIDEVDIDKAAILLISLGSEVNWQPWYVDHLYKGWQIL